MKETFKRQKSCQTHVEGSVENSFFLQDPEEVVRHIQEAVEVGRHRQETVAWLSDKHMKWRMKSLSNTYNIGSRVDRIEAVTMT